MKRLFVFGCSFTAYSWPTWADFLSTEFDYYENWALSGLGNRAIMERISECNAMNTFTKDDTVIVQWTTHLRNDFFHRFGPNDRPAGWKTAGSIFNYINVDLYDQKWIDNFFYEPAWVMHNLNYISMTQKFLNETGCNWYMTSIGDFRNLGSDLIEGNGYGEKLLLSEEDKKSDTYLAWKKYPELKVYNYPIWEKYEDKWVTPIILDAKTTPEQFFEFVDPDDNKVFSDMHPSPRQHARWLETYLFPKLNIATNRADQYYETVNSIEYLYGMHYKNKRGFELILQKGSFKQPTKFQWPNFYRGFR